MINEPTCGSGTMVIGAVWAMKQKDFDFRHKSFFVAQDIDIRCVWMAYIQLSLYGIPAVVIHGDTLAKMCIRDRIKAYKRISGEGRCSFIHSSVNCEPM